MKLERWDIQGLVKRGYSRLPVAKYCLLTIEDASRARTWVARLSDDVFTADQPNPEDHAVNVAFTHEGLERLGVTQHLDGDRRFSLEFEGGMVTEHRRRILGDEGDSDPERWAWGRPADSDDPTDPVHAVLMLFAQSGERLSELWREHEARLEGALRRTHTVTSAVLPGSKEHFGFRDGIAQPVVAGFGTRIPEGVEAEADRVFREGGSHGNVLAAGEFILGYPNVYGRMPSTPWVTESSDTGGFLHSAGGDGAKDLGRNGSYLVMRQLRQRVHRFWDSVDASVRERARGSDPVGRERLAAKMVGRWRDGSPLLRAPCAPDPTLATEDAFGYYEEDAHGYRCPVGAHIRRANPRDGQEPELGEPETAAENAMKHRLLRRGRPYGPPVHRSMEPPAVLAAGPEADGVERGLIFIALNANIGRQFEFVQHTWLNNPKFGGLYRETDPLFGPTSEETTARGITGDFTVPGPVRQQYHGLPRFIDVVGGGYFFLPSVRALRYIGALEDR